MTLPTIPLAKKSPLPEGTISIASGMGIGAITSYVAVILINQTVGDKAYAGFGAFWSLLFVVGPGLFLPIEQEIARGVSHRAARADGSKPFLRLAFSIALLIALTFSAIFFSLFSASKVCVPSKTASDTSLYDAVILHTKPFAGTSCSRV